MSDTAKIILLSVEDSLFEIAPGNKIPCYNVNFNISRIDVRVSIPILKKEIKNYCSIIPMAQHILALRLKKAAELSSGFLLSEEEQLSIVAEKPEPRTGLL